jgi:hypothetical protein
MKLLKKCLDYCDFPLHAIIIYEIIRIRLHRSEGLHYIVPIHLEKAETDKDKCTQTKIKQYCEFWLKVRRVMMYPDNCYYRSTILCTVLRKCGFNAILNFGSSSGQSYQGSNLIFCGNCWVSIDSEGLDKGYAFVVQYP